MSSYGAQQGERTLLQMFGTAAKTVLPVGALVAAFFTVPAFQETLCGMDALSARQGTVRRICNFPQSWSVTVPEATSVIDEFIAKGSGSDPSNILPRLSLSSSEERAKAVDQWRGILWAERVGRVQSPSRNQFSFVYRIYRGDANEASSGDVALLSQSVTIAFVERNDRRITLVNPPGSRQAPKSTRYPRAFAATETATSAAPRHDSDTILRLRAGDTVRLLCRLVTPDEVWFRTAQGWIDRSSLVGVEPSAASMRECEKRGP